MKYNRHISWMPKDDELVRFVFKQVMGYDIHKAPQIHKVSGRRLIGTPKMTDERSATLKRTLGRRIKITERFPIFWWAK